jgi:predicted phage terminase large subunit-like protein
MAATSNPGARWVYERWRPWLDPNHPDHAAPGEIRWVRLEGEEEVYCEYDPSDKLQWSRTFIPASYKDNPDLDQDEYERNLDLLPYIERQRLKHGDWGITEGSGKILNREWFGVVDKAPDGCWVYRYWDFAASEKKTRGDDPDYTATCYLATDGQKYYLRIDRKRVTWQTLKLWFSACVQQESWCVHGWEQEGGASGKILSAELQEIAARYGVGGHGVPASGQGDKVQRSQRWSSLAEQGRVYLLTGGEPIDNILHEFHSFPDGGHDDMVDAVSGAFLLASIGSGAAVGRY